MATWDVYQFQVQPNGTFYFLYLFKFVLMKMNKVFPFYFTSWINPFKIGPM